MIDRHVGRDDLDYSDPEHIRCQFSYEELQEISESLLYTWRNDPNVDRDYSSGVRKKVQRILKRARQKSK